jgi:hypothetical protein
MRFSASAAIGEPKSGSWVERGVLEVLDNPEDDERRRAGIDSPVG